MNSYLQQSEIIELSCYRMLSFLNDLASVYQQLNDETSIQNYEREIRFYKFYDL